MNEEDIWNKDYLSDSSLEALSVVKKAIDELDLFEDEFKDIFSADAGVQEGYTILDHTKMVLRQFDRYFSYKEFPDGITHDFFRILFVIHDLGKPLAVKRGNSKLQHEETVKLIDPIFKKLGLSNFERNLAKIIIGSDPIGPYLRYDKINESLNNIKKMIKESGLSSTNFFSVLLIYYMSDAGAYTVDAGGKSALDYVFSFDHENRKMDFQTDSKAKMSELMELIFN
ncbi:MAG: hypothetical protein WC915_05835 [archaeon]|jgi:hypothetical protein